MSEKVGGAEGTKLDDDFKEMERVSYHHIEFSLTKLTSILREGGRKERGNWYLRIHFVILKGTLFWCLF